MSDRLTLAHAIEDAGIARDKAEQLAATIFDRSATMLRRKPI